MNGITILIWITIAIIAIIAIIVVKLHYRGDELEKDEGSILEDIGSVNKVFSAGQNMLSKNDESKSNHPATLNQSKPSSLEKAPSYNVTYEEPVIQEVENNNYRNIEYESQNQVLINYDNTVEKFQEPIKQSQMDIMTQNNDSNNEKHELKDLFTIDELIKESKRKDSEREKEAHKSYEEDEELAELKESIKQKQEEKNIEEIIDDLPKETIEEILTETSEEEANEAPEEEVIEATEEEVTEAPEAEENIKDIVDKPKIEPVREIPKIEKPAVETPKVEETEIPKIEKPAVETPKAEETEIPKIETPSITSQEIEDAITTASKEEEESVESISESSGITDALLNNEESETKEDIKEPILKTPTKVKKEKTFGIDMKEGDEFGEYDNDLDYRKDLAKITNTIKGSKIFQDVKEKLSPEPVETPDVSNVQNVPEEKIEEEFIRNVNEYEDEYAPIINETHADYEATYEEYHRADFEDSIRQKNTRKVFDIAKSTPETPISESRISPIKQKPSRDNIKIKINNNDVVLKKGDEIIFNHDGETYSSQVYAINGDDISVKYRRKNITIKPSDVKKVY